MKKIKLEIYGNYHCKSCGTPMEPRLRLGYIPVKGVRCIHVCPKCGEIFIEESVRTKALTCIDRMLDFTKNHPDLLAKAQHGFVKSIGAA
jgi:hypothetical protein